VLTSRAVGRLVLREIGFANAFAEMSCLSRTTAMDTLGAPLAASAEEIFSSRAVVSSGSAA